MNTTVKSTSVYVPSEHSEEKKRKAVELANTRCQIGCKWADWDDLYRGTYGKTQHGKFAKFFATYRGTADYYSDLCQECPNIMRDTWKSLHEQQ